MRKRHNQWISNYACILALLCIFIIGSLILMNVGVHVYKNIVENNAQNFRLRTSLSYVASKIRQYDEAGKIYVADENGTETLCLKEELDSGSYTTMIYCYDGKLMELFHEDGLEYKLADGFDVLSLDDFKVQLEKNRVKLVAVDGEQADSMTISLRSEK